MAYEVGWTMVRTLLVLGIVLFALGGQAFGREPAASRVELTWNAPSGCMERDAARAAFSAALQTTSVRWAVVRVTISEQQPGQWNADMWMYGDAGSGERSVRGGSCDQVAQAAILVAVLALESEQQAEANKRPKLPATAPPAVRVAAGVRVAGDVGSLPEADLGLGLAAAVHFGQVRLEAEGTIWLQSSVENGPLAGSGGDFSLYAGTLRACVDLVHSERGAFDVSPCAGMEAGMVNGSGFGISNRRHDSVFWGAGLLGAAFQYLGLSPMWLGLLVEVGAPVHRAAWQIEQYGEVFQPEAVIGRLSLGARVFFP